jgi:hypothetical protein
MKNSNYNIWFALSYELVNIVSQQYPKLKQNKIVRLLLEYCKPDWILWKVETSLNQVDKQVEAIKKKWEKNEAPKYTIIEHEPDGSKAQELLGGAMEIKSNFIQN